MTIARWLVGICLVATITPAHAQSVEAEVLFREGKRLIKEGKLAEGCDKLDASERLESSVGTLLNLADCREKNGQNATAWAVFRKAAASAKAGGDSKRETEARRRASVLEQKLSYLTISVPDASAMEGLTLSRNGKPVDRALWNSAVPVDPGDYEISGQAAGYAQWTTRVEVKGEAQKAVVQVPRFKPLAEVTGDTKPKPITPDDSSEPDEPDEVSTPGTFTPMRKAAVAVGVVGVAGIVGGVVFGLKAKDLAKQADAICPTDACSAQQGVDLNHDARSKGLIANVAFGIGGAAVIGAAVLWFVGAPKASEQVSVVPSTGDGSAGLTVMGRF